VYYRQVKEINESLKKTGKAIISLGCSFVEGQGAIDQDLYDRLKWTMEKTGVPMEPELSMEEKENLVKEYPELAIQGTNIDWTFMEYKNAFVNVLCNKYFNGEYTPINFGLRGKGNRASMKSMYLWPDIDWHLAKEIIVLYVPSGAERFDFLNDEFNEAGQFHCMWPHWQDQDSGPRRTLWKGYNEGLYSEKQATLEQIVHMMDLVTWCKANNADLIITPGFDRTYSRDHFLNLLKDYIRRDQNQKITDFHRNADGPMAEKVLSNSRHEGHIQTLEKLVDQLPWDKFFYPQDCDTFMELCLKQEGITNKGFWDYNGIGTPQRWVTTCCHPSAKGHDLFAKELHKHITGNK
jgi:hypothetical protein